MGCSFFFYSILKIFLKLSATSFSWGLLHSKGHLLGNLVSRRLQNSELGKYNNQGSKITPYKAAKFLIDNSIDLKQFVYGDKDWARLWEWQN